MRRIRPTGQPVLKENTRDPVARFYPRHALARGNHLARAVGQGNQRHLEAPHPTVFDGHEVPIIE